MKFQQYLNEVKSNSIDLNTTKGPAHSITVLKYKDGKYGILNFSMNPDTRKYLLKNGFKNSPSTNYPYKVYDTREELDKALKNIFGINPKLVESN